MNVKLHARKRGFTLVELLVVMAIVASLAGISFVLLIRQQNKARERDSEARITAVNDVIVNYLADRNHDFDDLNPTSQSTETSTEELYGIITGDVNGDGKYDASDTYDHDNNPGTAEIQFPQYNKSMIGKIGTGRKSWFILDTDSGKYRVVDAFGTPLRFRTQNGKNTDFENGFDLWSCGQDQTTNISDDAAEESQDDITNWKG